MFHKIRIYGSEKLSSVWDGLLQFMGIPACEKNVLENTILFVGEHLPPRIGRMAKWIKRESHHSIVLLCHKRGFVPAFSDPGFDKVILFRNEAHLKRILKQFTNVSIIHGFAPKSYFPNVARKYLVKPYVHDMQDVYSIYYGKDTRLKWLQKELPHEIECLTQADGIVAHSLEPNAALRMLNIKKPKTLFFPLYCDDDLFQENRKRRDPDNIHLVYAGGVAGSHRDPAQYGNIQFHGLIKTLSQQKLHFHIYPSPSNLRSDYEEYEKMAGENDYFHFHPPIAQQELAKELGKYHFGLLPFFKNLSEQSELKLKYATTLKLFNYLEAGLPVIVSEDIFYQHWMLNRHKTAIGINEGSVKKLRDRILSTDYSEKVLSVKKAREKLSIRKNTIRLLDFYKLIISAA